MKQATHGELSVVHHVGLILLLNTSTDSCRNNLDIFHVSSYSCYYSFLLLSEISLIRIFSIQISDLIRTSSYVLFQMYGIPHSSFEVVYNVIAVNSNHISTSHLTFLSADKGRWQLPTKNEAFWFYLLVKVVRREFQSHQRCGQCIKKSVGNSSEYAFNLVKESGGKSKRPYHKK